MIMANALIAMSQGGVTEPVTLPAIADVYLRGGINADINYGAKETLVIKLSSIGSNDYDRKVFVKFSLSGVLSLSSATLRLVCAVDVTLPVNYTVSIYALEHESTGGQTGSAWSEMGITFNNARETENINGNSSTGIVDTPNVTFVGSISMPVDTSEGDLLALTDSRLVDFLNTKLGQEITLILVDLDESGGTLQLVSKETLSAYDPPQLIIE